MTAEQEKMTRDIALRVLEEPGASLDRLAWAHDVLAWMDMGDEAAAERCGYTPPVFAPDGICA